MNEYKKYLTDRLLSEEQPVTYRLLSRALDVHVNTAKEMLYDYHSYQNAQKPDSIHATYLVYGIKRNEKASEDGDVEMSSPVPEHDPTSEEVPSTTLSLVREENLKDALAGYQEVTSIHVYSLAPHPQRDLSLLSDVSKALSEYSLKDPDSTKYGAIINPQVRRRDRQARPKPTAPSSSKPTKSQSASVKPEPSATEPKPASAATKVKQEAKAEPPSKESTPSSSTSKPTPSQKKGVSGGIMQSFAKAAQKPAKPKQEPKKEKDTTMSDDGEADDDDIAPSKKADKGEDTGRKSRKEREEELRRMMEEDEDKEEDPEEEEEDPADEDMEEAPEPEPEPQAETKEDNEPSEVVSIENGRRRGKRRVMKKKRILDDQGYMVTIQEAGWESFSEDEAPPPAKKATPAATPASSGAKPKKPAGKGTQGNIMSFFSKK